LFGTKFVLDRTARYVVHMLKLWCHYVSLDKFYNLNVWIVPASLYSKVRLVSCPDHTHYVGYSTEWVWSGHETKVRSACTFVWEEICFQCNCSVCRSYVKIAASFDKFYNLNVWIVPASLYSKVRGRYLLLNLLFPVVLYISTRFLDFS